MKKRLTLRDIARLAGVSHMTVSRVLNNDPRVLAETVKRVMAVVEAQKYRPDPLARRFARGRSNLIGLMVSDIKNPFYAEMARGIEDQARKSGYLVIICSTDDQARALKRYAETVISAGIDGLIFASTRLKEPVVENLIDEGFPVLMVNRRLKAEIGQYVVLDNLKGAFLITQHLVESGYRKIAIITGPEDMSTAMERLWGYRAAMEENGLPLKEEYIQHVDFSRQGGFEAAMRILNGKAPPDAIFGGNDYIAMGIMNAAREMNLRIPEDLAVVGFDDTEFAESMGLTTVSQRVYEMGDLAVQILIQAIEQKTPGALRRVILEPKLIVRKSSRIRGDGGQGISPFSYKT